MNVIAVMRSVILIAALLVLSGLTGCYATKPNQKSLLETIEFGEDESGCARIQGNLDISTGFFVSSTVAVTIIKKKGEDIPDC